MWRGVGWLSIGGWYDGMRQPCVFVRRVCAWPRTRSRLRSSCGGRVHIDKHEEARPADICQTCVAYTEKNTCLVSAAVESAATHSACAELGSRRCCSCLPSQGAPHPQPGGARPASAALPGGPSCRPAAATRAPCSAQQLVWLRRHQRVPAVHHPLMNFRATHYCAVVPQGTAHGLQRCAGVK